MAVQQLEVFGRHGDHFAGPGEMPRHDVAEATEGFREVFGDEADDDHEGNPQPHRRMPSGQVGHRTAVAENDKGWPGRLKEGLGRRHIGEALAKIVLFSRAGQPMMGHARRLLDRDQGAFAPNLRAHHPIPGGGQGHQQGMVVLRDSSAIGIIRIDYYQGCVGGHGRAGAPRESN